MFLFTEDFRTILRSLALTTITFQRNPVLWIILSGAVLVHCSTRTARGSTEIVVLSTISCITHMTALFEKSFVICLLSHCGRPKRLNTFLLLFFTFSNFDYNPSFKNCIYSISLSLYLYYHSQKWSHFFFHIVTWNCC